MNVRKVLSLALILLLTFTLAVPAFASVDLSDPQYVVDDANVLSAETEQKILVKVCYEMYAGGVRIQDSLVEITVIPYPIL